MRVRMSASFAVVLMVTAVSFAQMPLSSEKILKQADEESAADRFTSAESLYRSLLDSPTVYFRRQASERLLALYIRSNRPDKAIQLSRDFRTWLRDLGDREALAGLELQLGDCYLNLGHYIQADEHFQKALNAVPRLAPMKRLQALRGRAETASQRHDEAEQSRWKDLENEAVETDRLARDLRDNWLRLLACRNLAVALDRLGQTDKALAVLEPLPAIHDQLNDPIGRRDTQRQRANLLATQNRYLEAVPLFVDALAIQRSHRPGKRMATGDILSEWATAASASGQAEIAKLRRDEAMLEYKAVIEDPAAGDADGGPLAAFMRLQSLTRSARQFRQALELNQSEGERWSGDELLASRLKADRGGLELVATSYNVARDLLAESLAQLDRADPPDLRALPRVLVNLATAELAGDAPQNAEDLLNRCIALYTTHQLPSDPIRADCDYLKGALAVQRGEFAAAIAHFRSGLARCDLAGSSADSVRFNLWLNTALVHKEQGDHVAAQEALTHAREVLSRFAEKLDISVGLIAAVGAELHLTKDQLKEAIAELPTIRLVCEQNGIRSGYLWATAQHLGALEQWSVRHNVAEAERIWSALADVQRRDRQMQLARTLNFLGMAAEVQSRTQKAIKIFEEARALQENRPWMPVKTKAITLWRLAILADKAGDAARARKLLMQVFDVADQARLTTFGEASQRATFFAQFTPMFETLVNWAARDGDGELLLTVAARSRSRTLLDQVVATGVNPKDGLNSKDRDRLREKETEARRRASLARSKLQLLTAAEAEGEVGQKLIAELEAARQEYSDVWREIVNVDPLARVLTTPGFAEQAIAELRQRVAGSRTAILTYIIGRSESYAVLIPNAKDRPIIYRIAAPESLTTRLADSRITAVASASASLRGIELSAAPGIEAVQPERPQSSPTGRPLAVGERVVSQLIEPYLIQVRNPSFAPTRGILLSSKDAEKPTMAANPETIGDILLPLDLRERLKSAGTETLVVIPDGPLHKIPIESLLVTTASGPRYALDELPAVCVSPSAAVLVTAMSRRLERSPSRSLLTVSDPAYAQVQVPGSVVSTTRNGMIFGALEHLPGTAEESRRIQMQFPKEAVTALAGPDATEKQVVAAITGKTFIHLAAHGFADERFGGLYAAVALTPPSPGLDPSPDDDGFLSIPEIYRLKLNSCELTVLSACVTNVGPQRPLEAGVTLAGAFLSAGSRRVLASCWAVSDRATADLMSHFFSAIQTSNGKTVSYPAAMKEARQKLKSDPRFASPFYWAPFVLVGVPD